MQSKQALIRRALQKVKVLAAGQAPAAEDVKVVDDLIVPLLSDLSIRDIYQFGDPDKIEDEAFEHLATILASAIAPDFGQASDEQVRLLAESRLRAVQAQSLSYQPAQAEYF